VADLVGNRPTEENSAFDIGLGREYLDPIGIDGGEVSTVLKCGARAAPHVVWLSSTSQGRHTMAIPTSFRMSSAVLREKLNATAESPHLLVTAVLRGRPEVARMNARANSERGMSSHKGSV
jgi:hypothetical protein